MRHNSEAAEVGQMIWQDEEEEEEEEEAGPSSPGTKVGGQCRLYSVGKSTTADADADAGDDQYANE
jgi:hypothetical protein